MVCRLDDDDPPFRQIDAEVDEAVGRECLAMIADQCDIDPARDPDSNGAAEARPAAAEKR
jgi:hypothetical protein